MRILNPDGSGVDAQNPPGGVAQLENVSGQAFDREIFIHCADERFAWLEQNAIVARVRNGSAAGQRQQPRATPTADAMVDRVIVNEGGAPSTFRAETFAQHADDLVEFVP